MFERITLLRKRFFTLIRSEIGLTRLEKRVDTAERRLSAVLQRLTVCERNYNNTPDELSRSRFERDNSS